LFNSFSPLVTVSNVRIFIQLPIIHVNSASYPEWNGKLVIAHHSRLWVKCLLQLTEAIICLHTAPWAKSPLIWLYNTQWYQLLMPVSCQNFVQCWWSRVWLCKL